MKRLATGSLLTALAVMGPLAAPAFAQADLATIEHSVNELWLVMAGILVMFMQPGFALVESGFTRAKNAGNIVMKNFMDFSVGALVYWAVGFAFAYGGTSVGGFIATGDFFLGDSSRASEWFFQVVFAATAATIVSGAVAERVKFTAYLIYTPFITGLIYPVVTHWTWSGAGWLTDLGYSDFAGSGIVHLVGATAALAGVMVVGPRIGKYDENGKPVAIPGHSLTLGALGVFILWFGWYGFNAGSWLAAVDVDLASVVVTTTLAPAAGATAAMFLSWFKLGKPDVGLALNGALAGLVGITAGADSIAFGASIIVGLIAGAIVVYSIIGLERMGIDDPVGAISVHGAAGIWGVIAVAAFGGGSWSGQLIGVAAIIGWTFVTSFVVFKIVDMTIGLRVSAEEELAGLDRTEHGTDSWPEFVFQETMAPPREYDPVGSGERMG
ncbi:MAG: ammonium transporter [Acidimicrobiia bacterium]|nr:ammonium transporter [Acidimicrobiia bacterium]